MGSALDAAMVRGFKFAIATGCRTTVATGVLVSWVVVASPTGALFLCECEVLGFDNDKSAAPTFMPT